MDWLEEGHLAYFILDLVETLDLREIREAIDSKDPRGTRPYSPRMMVTLLLYGYCTGVYSSRRIERATYEEVPFRVLSGGAHPHFTRINAFRKTHLEALGGLFVQGYNCQAAVDDAHQVIVAQAVTNQSPDNGNLAPMVGWVETNCGASAEVTTADAGYWSPDGVERAAQGGSDLFISTKRDRHGTPPEGDEAEPERCDGPRARMRAKLSTPRGRAIYAKRKSTVEPVFGQIKGCRGFRQFSLRGLVAVGGEWSLICACHNLLKLFRYGGTVAAIPG